MRTQKDRDVCDSKVLYDTEFEAQRGAAIHKDEMYHYRCPGTLHYHISHVDRSKRLGHGSNFRCPKCGVYRAKKGASKHVRKCRGIDGCR